MNVLRVRLKPYLSVAPKTRRLFTSAINHNESFLSPSSGQYVEDMYNAWLADPQSVHASWNSYFGSISRGVEQGAYQRPPALAPLGPNEVPLSAFKGTEAATGGAVNERALRSNLAVQSLIRSYQARGHLVAQLDPLGIMYKDRTTTISDRMGSPPEVIMRKYNLSGHMDDIYKLPSTTFIGAGQAEMPLKEIIRRLELAYCRHIGVEFMYIDNFEERDFIRTRMETPGSMEMSKDLKRLTLERLVRTHEFEMFLARKWSSEKRFGLEGCDVLIPIIKQIIDRSALMGVESFIVGLAHRGRLNFLANVCRKPLYQLFTQFAGLEAADEGSGDVKYHLGTSIERLNRVANKNIKICLVANPSHLEAVDPVVLGRTRAEQFYKGDAEGKKSMAILVHGDASFCGQGVVYESFHLSYLPCYTTHGTIHLVLNNQIGFTTDPRHSRSSRYCSDVGRVVNAPIFHVNSDCIESGVHVANIAAEWRAQFHKDIVVDVVGYRRNGHNEVDEPMFTQPLMYTKIRGLKPIMDKYAEQLIEEKVVTAAEVEAERKKYLDICEEAHAKASKETQMLLKDWLDTPWSGFFEGKNPLKMTPTGVSEETLVHVGRLFASPPPASMEFVLHKGIERILKLRMEMVQKRTIDWALGEAMAIGSLLKEGIHVRMSGEDVERGTFSHRHHVLHHQTNDKTVYNSMMHLYPDQASFTICNSSLSEYGVMGFELGYSTTNPHSLVIWEAQFGDFFNTAQPIVDQFVSSGQTKWVRQSGLVILLPHGYEGMGPEHSSARMERFLQMCSDDQDVFPQPRDEHFAMRQLFDNNWIIANCTTPGNLFHILRRQIALPFRKPLIMFTPKSLLRHPSARSSFDEMLPGTEFRRIIPEADLAAANPQEVRKLMFCTGKVYYDVKQARDDKKMEKEIAITRVEQIAPFPYDLVKGECERFPNAKLFWCQEEPKNYGAFTYVHPRFKTALGGAREVGYIGRPAACSPATGNKYQHKQEVHNLMADATAL